MPCGGESTFETWPAELSFRAPTVKLEAAKLPILQMTKGSENSSNMTVVSNGTFLKKIFNCQLFSSVATNWLPQQIESNSNSLQTFALA
jgi:hypothetical protein